MYWIIKLYGVARPCQIPGRKDQGTDFMTTSCCCCCGSHGLKGGKIIVLSGLRLKNQSIPQHTHDTRTALFIITIIILTEAPRRFVEVVLGLKLLFMHCAPIMNHISRRQQRLSASYLEGRAGYEEAVGQLSAYVGAIIFFGARHTDGDQEFQWWGQ